MGDHPSWALAAGEVEFVDVGRTSTAQSRGIRGPLIGPAKQTTATERLPWLYTRPGRRHEARGSDHHNLGRRRQTLLGRVVGAEAQPHRQVALAVLHAYVGQRGRVRAQVERHAAQDVPPPPPGAALWGSHSACPSGFFAAKNCELTAAGIL